MKWLALFVLVACGDNVPDRAEPRSGDRLKLGWYVYDGGARHRDTRWYYDNVLRVRCATTRWSDGHTYCTPVTDEAVYVGDTCTRALGRTVVNVPPAPLFATTFTLDDEQLPSRLFERGEQTEAPISIWHKTSDGCIGPTPPGDGFDYFDLGNEILLADLVRVRHGQPHGDGELAVIYELGEDGLRVPSQLFHRRAATICETTDRPNATTLECVPPQLPIVSYFHDPACNEPELGTTLSEVPAIARRYESTSSCWYYYAVGEEVSAPPLFEHNSAGCFAVPAPAGQRFFVMGPPHMVPGLARIREPNSARMQTIMRVSGDLRLNDPLVFDSELDADCEPSDDLRCVPATRVIVEPFFADPQCQIQLALAQVPAGTCDPPVRFARHGDDFLPLLAPYAQTIYVPSTGDTCGIYQPPAPFVAYTVGPALDRSRFPVGELQIDP